MAGKKYGPSKVLPCMMMTFGFMTLMTVAAHNFAGLMALRWFLGMAESAFFPLVIYYLTTFYRRGELARRLAIFYAASNIANAFSGLLSFGVFQIKHTSLAEWRYLFIVEGSATMLFAVFAYWYLPFSAAKAKFLNEDEQKLAFMRMQMDSSSIVNEKFVFKDAVAIFKHPTSWIILCKSEHLSNASLTAQVLKCVLVYLFNQSHSSYQSSSNVLDTPRSRRISTPLHQTLQALSCCLYWHSHPISPDSDSPSSLLAFSSP